MGVHAGFRGYYYPDIDEEYLGLVNTDTFAAIDADVHTLFTTKVDILTSYPGVADTGNIHMTGDIGADATLRGNALAIAAAATIGTSLAVGTTLAVTGAATLSSTLGVTGAATVGSLASLAGITAVTSIAAGTSVSAGAGVSAVTTVLAGGDITSTAGNVASAIGRVTAGTYMQAGSFLYAGSYVHATTYAETGTYANVGTYLGVGVDNSAGTNAQLYILAPTAPAQLRLARSSTRYLDFTVDSLGQTTITTSGSGPGTQLIFLGTGTAIRSSPFTSGVNGWNIDTAGNAEFWNMIIRGAFTASVFKIGEMLALGGTVILSKNSSQFNANVVLSGTIGQVITLCQIKKSSTGASVISNNDILWTQYWNGSNAIHAVYFTVSAKDDTPTGYSTCTLTVKAIDGVTAGSISGFTIPKDVPVTNIGSTSGDSYMSLSADGTKGGAGNITVIKHDGSPWLGGTHESSPWRAGNLRNTGIYGATDTFGMIAGNDIGLSTTSLVGFSVDAVNGLRMWNTPIANHLAGTQTVLLASTGEFRLGTSVGSPSNTTFLATPASLSWGGETLPAGSVLFGPNGGANLLWNGTQFQVRTGFTVLMTADATALTVGRVANSRTRLEAAVASGTLSIINRSSGGVDTTRAWGDGTGFFVPIHFYPFGSPSYPNFTDAAATTSSVFGAKTNITDSYPTFAIHPVRLDQNGTGTNVQYYTILGNSRALGPNSETKSVEDVLLMACARTQSGTEYPVGLTVHAENSLTTGSYNQVYILDNYTQPPGGTFATTARFAAPEATIQGTLVVGGGNRLYAHSNVPSGYAIQAVANVRVFHNLRPTVSVLTNTAGVAAHGRFMQAIANNTYYTSNMDYTGSTWNLDDGSFLGCAYVQNTTGHYFYTMPTGSHTPAVYFGVEPTVVATTNANLLVQGNSTYINLGLHWNNTTGAFYLGASNAASPELWFSNNAGTVLWAMTDTGILHNNNNGKYISFTNTGLALPSFTTRSLGTKIILYEGVSGTTTDYAIGLHTDGTFWCSVATTGQVFKWFGGVTTAATLTGTGTWTPASDRRLKMAFTDIDALAIIRELGPVQKWQWRSTGAVNGRPVVFDTPNNEGWQVGPVGQQFHAAGFGVDPTTLSTANVAGLALAGVQQLTPWLTATTARVEQLERELADVRRAIAH